MAMTIKTEGLDELNSIISRLNEKAYDVAAESLYEGADVIADAFTSAVNRIQTEPWTGKKDKRKPSPAEKAALQGKSGIARFNKSGDGVDTLIGISGAAGYAKIGGKQKAVRLIARSINSGTSFMPKQPVFRQALSSSQNQAKAKLVKKAEELFNEIINS